MRDGIPLSERTWIAFRNTTAETIPAHGVLKIAAGEWVEGVLRLLAEKPDGSCKTAINGPRDVTPGNFGSCTLAHGYPAVALVGAAVLEAGDAAGPQGGQWWLGLGSGYTVVSDGPIAGTVMVVRTGGEMIAFELAASLDPNSHAEARILRWDTATEQYVVDELEDPIRVTNYSGVAMGADSDQATFTGLAGYRGTAAHVLDGHEERYEILWLEHIARKIEGLATSWRDEAKGFFEATVWRWSDGRQPPALETVHVFDPHDGALALFPRPVINNSRFVAVWNDHRDDADSFEHGVVWPHGRYELVECDQVSPIGRSTASKVCSGDVPLQGPPLPMMQSPFGVLDLKLSSGGYAENPFGLAAEAGKEWLFVRDEQGGVSPRWVAVQAEHVTIEKVVSDLSITEMPDHKIYFSWKEHQVQVMRCQEPEDKFKEVTIAGQTITVVSDLNVTPNDRGAYVDWKEREVKVLDAEDETQYFKEIRVTGPTTTNLRDLTVTSTATGAELDWVEETIEVLSKGAPQAGHTYFTLNGVPVEVIDDIRYSGCKIEKHVRRLSVLGEMVDDPSHVPNPEFGAWREAITLVQQQMLTGLQIEQDPGDEYNPPTCGIGATTATICTFEAVGTGTATPLEFTKVAVMQDWYVAGLNIEGVFREIYVPCFGNTEYRTLHTGTDCEEEGY